MSRVSLGVNKLQRKHRRKLIARLQRSGPRFMTGVEFDAIVGDLNCYCVYFARCGNAIKVGASGSPRKRIRALTGGWGSLVGIVGPSPNKRLAFSLEHFIHRKFRPDTIGHEWYEVDSGLGRFVSIMMAGPRSPRRLSELLKNRGFDSLELTAIRLSSDQALPPTLLTHNQAARRIGISKDKLYRMVGAGNVPCLRLGTTYRDHLKSLLAWIQAQDRSAVDVGRADTQ